MNITNKFTTYMLALALLVGLNGCSSMSARERSTAIGAGVGAAVGAVVTGGFIGTSVGAAAGAVVGNQMGKK
jgi:osmotically inducible lipoprotein OsmB